MECYLLSEPTIRGYRKFMLSLWLQKGMFWLSEQRLVDQANTIHRNSWMTELEIEELERKVTGSDSVIVEEARSVEALPDHVGEDMRNYLPEMGAEEHPAVMETMFSWLSMVTHGYFMDMFFLFNTHGQECNHSATKT